MTTIEHISRYLIQLGEASVEEAYKVRFFPLSLSGPAFSWFSSLEPNSIIGWADLENKFHAYFYSGTGEKKITDLTSMRQRNNESDSKFIQRSKGSFLLIKSVWWPIGWIGPSGDVPGTQRKIQWLRIWEFGPPSSKGVWFWRSALDHA